jgi:hypothetical protein
MSMIDERNKIVINIEIEIRTTDLELQTRRHSHQRTHIDVSEYLENVLLYKLYFRFEHTLKFQKKKSKFI